MLVTTWKHERLKAEVSDLRRELWDAKDQLYRLMAYLRVREVEIPKKTVIKSWDEKDY